MTPPLMTLIITGLRLLGRSYCFVVSLHVVHRSLMAVGTFTFVSIVYKALPPWVSERRDAESLTAVIPVAFVVELPLHACLAASSSCCQVSKS